MKQISIERALVWAYREQLVHVALPPGMPVEACQGYSPALSEGQFLADRVDSSVKVGFAAAPDAYAIHQRVQHLQPVMIGRGQEEMEMLYARRLLRNDFDSMNHLGTGNATRPTATVQVLPRALVQQHAMDANHPDRCVEPCTIFEKGARVYTNRNGMIVTHHTRFGFNMLNVVGDDPLEVIELRRKYAVWRAALVYLQKACADLLTAHVLTDELPPAGMPI
jgi:hypothetical protein